MTTKDSTQRPSGRRRRRSTSAVAAGGVALLTACSTGSASTAQDPASAGTVAADVLPAHVPVEVAEPDFPGVDGSAPGYLSIPDPLGRAFDEPPGTGMSITAMTPLWGTIPPTEGNAYFDAVNEAMGTDVQFQISDGNTYGDKLAAVLSSPQDVADWVSIPTWNEPPRFGEAVEAVFQDLSPHLSGDAVADYPHLANIPTEAWQACAWNGKIYGIPYPQEVGLTDFAMYRDDLLPDAQMPTDADEMLAFVQEAAGDGGWGTNDLWATATVIHGVLPANGWEVGEDGALVHRVETQEYRDALEWMTELYASGAVHPDAVADNQADAGTRFESGQVAVTSTGVGYWHEALTRNRTSDPDFSIAAVPVFAADGGDPVLYKPSGANICSYVKATDDEAKVREILTAADFLASPFGTEEYQLVNYGVEGLHYELDEQGLPVPTTLGQTEVQPSYIFLADPPAVNAKVALPDYVEEQTAWAAENSQHMVEPLFYGQNISEPSRFASLGQPFDDLEKDIARGRKSMADLDAAVETWRTSGGEELRAFYTELHEAQQGAGETPAS